MSTSSSKPVKKAAEAPKGASTDSSTEAPAQEVQAPSGDFGGNSGPMTGTPAEPESSERTPSTIVGDAGAPLDPPADTPTQTQPEQGYNESSTDHVYAEAGGRTIAGEDHYRLVDDNGRKVAAGSLFDDSDGSKTFVIAKKRVYEEFYYPNTTEVAKRLLFPKGKRVPRAQAEKIKAAIDAAPEPLAQQ